tara:strand:- start:468 stop:764 length:297 start_codon:yes stop_codon:yes gene_type:complete
MLKNNNNLTKKEIINKIHKSIGLNSSYIHKIVDDLILILSVNIKNDDLRIKNFGSFRILKKNERIGRDPKSKINYKISARNSLSFVSSNKLNKKINKL